MVFQADIIFSFSIPSQYNTNGDINQSQYCSTSIFMDNTGTNVISPACGSNISNGFINDVILSAAGGSRWEKANAGNGWNVMDLNPFNNAWDLEMYIQYDPSQYEMIFNLENTATSGHQECVFHKVYPTDAMQLFITSADPDTFYISEFSVDYLRDGVLQTFVPTLNPTVNPTSSPATYEPTEFPTPNPTPSPTTHEPTTDGPTTNPTPSSTEFPTPSPTDNPTPSPTNNPTALPSDLLTNPTVNPTDSSITGIYIYLYHFK